jgi:hypothetical protein
MKQQQSLQERIESGGGGWPRELTVSNRFPAGSHIHFFNVTSAAATNFLREDSVAYKFSLLDSESSPFAIGENDGN